MSIVISGSSGLVGAALVTDLRARGHDVVRLVRAPDAARDEDARYWDPVAGELDPAHLDGCDAVINLNGYGIGERRWSPEVKKVLRASRLQTTRVLAETMTTVSKPCPLLVNASAVGYYGDRGEELLDEGAPPGSGFLAELTQEWETAARAASTDSIRVVPLRLGMVIARGGALARMLPPFSAGLGGPIGSGRQWWPWICLDDVVGAVRHVLETPQIQGPVNAVSPGEIRCRGFVRTLGRVLRRPAVLPLPALLARIALGEMADSLLLASSRARPSVLLEHGFDFRFPELEPALRHVLKRNP